MNVNTLTEIRHLLYNKDMSEKERDEIEKVLFKLLRKRNK